MTSQVRALAAAALVLLVELGHATTAPLVTVGHVDVARYVGRWFEIAHYPNRFQRDCVGDTTAEYSRRDDGKLQVVNRCVTAAGVTEAVGVARPVDAATDRLEVSFLPALLRWLPFGWGDYWVIGLAPDYRYAVIGEPSRQYLWVLARTPVLSAEDRRAIDALLRERGYDPARLVDTRQSER